MRLDFRDADSTARDFDGDKVCDDNDDDDDNDGILDLQTHARFQPPKLTMTRMAATMLRSAMTITTE